MPVEDEFGDVGKEQSYAPILRCSNFSVSEVKLFGPLDPDKLMSLSNRKSS